AISTARRSSARSRPARRRKHDAGKREGKDPIMPTVAPLDLDGHVIAAAFLGDVPFFATASGAIHRLDQGEKVTEAHDGLLACVRDEANDTLITGGEDGRVLRIAADGSATLLAEVPRKWISV